MSKPNSEVVTTAVKILLEFMLPEPSLQGDFEYGGKTYHLQIEEKS
jgi:hypothetical protein